MELNVEHRLTEVEERSKSNTHRIDKLEASTEAINRLATSMEVMAAEQQHQTAAISGIKTDVAKLDSKVETIEQKPAKKWDGFVDKVFYLVLGAVVAYLLSKIGL